MDLAPVSSAAVGLPRADKVLESALTDAAPNWLLIIMTAF